MFIGTGNTDHKYVNPININDPSSYKRTVIANNLSLEYRNEHVILSSITGHQYFKDDMKMDQDFSPLSIFTLNQKQKQNAFSEELAIKSNTRNNYQWSFGLYGFYDDLHTDGPVDFKEDGIKTVLQPVFDQLKKDHPKMPYLKYWTIIFIFRVLSTPLLTALHCITNPLITICSRKACQLPPVSAWITRSKRWITIPRLR